MCFRIITISGGLSLDLGKLDRSAFLEGLLGRDERIIVALKEEVCRLRGLNCLSGADESFVLKMVVVLDSALLAENFDALVIAVRSLTAVVDDADGAVCKLQSDDCGVDIVILGIAGIGRYRRKQLHKTWAGQRDRGSRP